MSSRPRRYSPARRVTLSSTVVLALVGLCALTPISTVAAADTRDDARYIVQLDEHPLAMDSAAVDSGSDARTFDSRSAISAESALKESQRAAALSVGAVVDQSFTTVLNGFSTSLSTEQAAELARRPGVLSVAPERVFTLDAVTSADALGLPGATGVWQALGGATDAGAGVVIGMIDSGIAPENPAFAGAPLAAASADPTVPHLAGTTLDGGISTRMKKANGGSFAGECESSATFAATACSTKVIGARVFDDGPSSGTILVDNRTEYASPRDASGHGSHTAAIAAGDLDVPATASGVGPVDISGVAPAARLAVYKACWLDALFGTGRCAESDLVAAIDAAVNDGVDVINYSIGSGSGDQTVAGPVDLALLRAASAGVFVAASAGNSGPEASTVDHTEPWVTTVAASTTQRGAMVLIGGDEYAGVSSTVYGRATTDARLVQDRSNPASQFCRAGSLDPGIVRGTVVLCLRSSTTDSATARLAASSEVLRAGGIGMILANTATSSIGLPVEAHAVPTIQVAADAGAAIAAKVVAGVTVSFEPAPLPASLGTDPAIADFSSRGPATTGYGNVLKPDLAAPGVQVLSASTNAPGAASRFRILSGTSMASPQVAGLAALALAADPDASPASVRSALMTSARATADDADPFTEGAGVVDLSGLLHPGFVYDAGADDWNGYLNGLGIETGTRATPIHGSDLNQPSLAIASLAGTRTIERTVTSTEAGSYTATAALPGFDVSVSPALLRFTAAGQPATFTVTITAADAPLATFARGAITWSGTSTGAGATHAIVSTFPMVVRPVAVSSEPPLVELPELPDPDPSTPPTPDPDPSPDPSPQPTRPVDEEPAPSPTVVPEVETDSGAPATTDEGTTLEEQEIDEQEPVAGTPTPGRPTPTPPPASQQSAPVADDTEPAGSLFPALPITVAVLLALVIAAGFITVRIRTRG